MSRTIKEIYLEAVGERNKRLELSEFNSDSKMSIMNGLTWAFSAVIYAFESLLEIFMVDVSTALNNRINGTPSYYANALLQYQKGDILKVREDGLAFGYSSVDPTKRIVTQVSYNESTSDVNLDNKLILKVATGEKGKLSAIPPEEVVLLTAYINQIKFAGTRIEVVSRKGDILVPRLSVFYDGSVRESEIYDEIEENLNEYIMSVEFNAAIYVNGVLDAIRSVDHVTDVYIDTESIPEQGVFLVCYDSDGHNDGEKKIQRMSHTASGYIRQSTCKGDEVDYPNFRQAIKLIIDNGCDTTCLQTD